MTKSKAQYPLSVFIVEDNEWYRKFLTHIVSLNPDFHVQAFETGEELLKNLHTFPDVITLDYRLPDYTGDTLLKEIKALSPDTEVIIISEQEDIEVAVSLLKAGAYDYMVKSNDIQTPLLNSLLHLSKNKSLHTRISTLEKEVGKQYAFSETIIGESPRITTLFPILEKAANSSIQVTITGETGTGKEVVAKSIHYQSVRKSKPFVAVNMAAIPSELIESELFGHEKGAFTGALTRRIGKFEEADGGTLFLDEIGETSLPLQAKLLRAIQEKEIVRVGSNQPVKTDIRIIVATHRNLEEMVKQGTFRQDLFFRLLGLKLELAPLRERGKDIILLAKYFMNQYCRNNTISVKQLSEQASLKLLSYSFPGNVRELKSIIELAVVLSNTQTIESDDIVLGTTDVLTTITSESLTLKQYEFKIVQAHLQQYGNNIKLVAEKLDISVATIYRMLKEHGQ